MKVSTEEWEKLEKQPRWVLDLVKRIAFANEPLIEEATRCRKAESVQRQRAERFATSNAALMELLTKAGQAGLDWAKIVVATLEGYEIFRNSNQGD